jgi:acetoin:2,6-dichlorophenolindophenol oxidoreductase subunit alpha
LFLEGIVHGTTHLCQGQEAVAVGIAAATRPTDPVACTYRGHGVALALGLTPRALLAEVMGRGEGCVGGVGGSMHLVDLSVGLLPTFAIVGAGIPVAAGAALTAQVRGTDDVGVAVFGDGASNIGAFHETLNLAAVWRLPVVFVCENNRFGEYSHITRTTPVEDLAVRAEGYAIPAEIVDGQDVEAVAECVGVAVDRARAGQGPQFVECKTYRYAGHSRSDTAPYRDETEYRAWLERDPIDILADRLVAEGVITADTLADIRRRRAETIEALVAELRDAPYPSVHAMFEHVYAP